MHIKLHSNQEKVFKSEKKVKVVCSGIQGGKTTIGAVITSFEMMKYCNDPTSNFIICAPTYKILNQATLPKFLQVAEKYGKYNGARAEFKLNWGATCYLRTATDPDSMEGITNVRMIWLDEGGKVSKYFYENIEGRAAFKQAPIVITTTPYALNWLHKLAEDVKKGKRDDVELVQFRSIDNPYFPKEEYERQKKILDPRRFAMKYMGEFGQLEGLVFEKINLVKSFQLPPGTKFYYGIDWGYHPDPFALTIRAVLPNGTQYRIGEFYKTLMIADDIINVVKSRNQIYPCEMCFCDPSRPDTIAALCKAGIKAVGANNDIMQGIDEHIKLIRTNRFFIFEDMNPLGIDEYQMYHFPEIEELSVDQDLEPAKPVDKYNHGVDADRYVSMGLSPLFKDRFEEKRETVKILNEYNPRPTDNAKRIEWIKKRNIYNQRHVL